MSSSPVRLGTCAVGHTCWTAVLVGWSELAQNAEQLLLTPAWGVRNVDGFYHS